MLKWHIHENQSARTNGLKTLYTSVAPLEHLNDLDSTFSEYITPLDETDKLSCEGKVS